MSYKENGDTYAQSAYGSGGGSSNGYDGTRAYYGEYLSSNGSLTTTLVLPSSLRSSLAGLNKSDIDSVTLKFTNLHTYANGGGSVKYGFHSSASVAHHGVPSPSSTVTVPNSGSVTHSVPSSQWDALLSAGSIVFGEAVSGRAGYGFLDAQSVRISVKYTS
jgi:hypothetical protein